MRSAPARAATALIALFCVQLACGPLNRAGSTPTTAPQQIIVVVPADTSTPLPTLPPTPRASITPIPLNTAGPTPSPTPDLRLVQGEPKDFQLTREDLPPAAGYRMLEEGSSINPTERDDAWWSEFNAKVGDTDFYSTMWERDRDNLAYPDLISCDVGKFTSLPFAGVYLDDYNVIKDVERANGIYRAAVDEFPRLGNARVLAYRDYEYEGKTETYYVIMASYQNYIIECWGGGLKDDVPPDFIAELVQIIINKLEGAPLLPSATGG